MKLTDVRSYLLSWMRFMTFLLETTVPLLALIGTGLVSAGLVMLLMSLGMPDEK